MKEWLFDSVRCGSRTVRYYLLTETLGREIEAYGILVEDGEERVSLPALTLSQSRVQDLLLRMVQGLVTPITARDIAEDWLLL